MTTLKRIAEKAGVSLGTVDRVLHNRGRVSRESEKRVRKALRDLDYTPNIFARQLRLDKAFRFGVLMPGSEQDSGFWRMPETGVQRAVNELRSHRIEARFFHYNRYSETSFVRVADSLLKYELDGLILVPVLTVPAHRFLSRIPPDLPYIFLDSSIPGKPLCSIVQDARLSGTLAARLMHLLVRDGSVAVMRVLPRDLHIDERVQGFTEYTEEEGRVRIVKVDLPRENEQYDFHEVTGRLIRNPEIQGIFVTNALTHCVARTLAGHDRKVNLIGYDLIPENIEFLKQGTIDFLISQRSEHQGYQAVYTLFRHLVLKESVPERIEMPLDIMTKENVDFHVL